MEKNPFKFTGPLLPGKDHDDNIIFRRPEVDNVVDEIRKGKYWAILGPRQIGKSTFLNLIQEKLGNSVHTLYIDLEANLESERDLYRLLINEFLEVGQNGYESGTLRFNSEFFFEKFLWKFQPNEEKNVVILLDEVDGVPGLEKFLKNWRSVFHNRVKKKAFMKYTVVTCGSSDLVRLTVGKTSPFNIARKLFLKDFTPAQTRAWLSQIFKRAPEDHVLREVTFDEGVEDKFITMLGGHPQMMQHACYYLVEAAYKREKKNIEEDDIDKTARILFEENDSFQLLKENIESDTRLKELVLKILNKQTLKFLLYQEYSLSGAGIITGSKNICKIRNDVFVSYLKDYLSEDKIVQKDLSGELEKKSKMHVVDRNRKNFLPALFEALVFLGVLIGIVLFYFKELKDIKGGLWIGIVMFLVFLALFCYFLRERVKKKNE